MKTSENIKIKVRSGKRTGGKRSAAWRFILAIQHPSEYNSISIGLGHLDPP